MLKKILFTLIIMGNISYTFDISDIEIGDTLYIPHELIIVDEVEVLEIDKKGHKLYCRKPDAKREWISQYELLTYWELSKMRVGVAGSLLFDKNTSQDIWDWVEDSMDYGEEKKD